MFAWIFILSVLLSVILGGLLFFSGISVGEAEDRAIRSGDQVKARRLGIMSAALAYPGLALICASAIALLPMALIAA